MIQIGVITRAEQRKIKRVQRATKETAAARRTAKQQAEYEKWVKLIGWPAPENCDE